jgi:hypothetical protein
MQRVYENARQLIEAHLQPGWGLFHETLNRVDPKCGHLESLRFPEFFVTEVGK